MTRILLIEAEPGERLILRSRLVDLGHTVTTAESGARGIVEARAGHYDLVLLGAELGDGADGAEVCRRMKAVPSIASTPVLIYTKQAGAGDVADRMYDAGCDAFVTKPQLASLDRLMRVHLRVKSRQDELREQNRLLEMENRRLAEQRQRSADIETSHQDSGSNALLIRELAAGRPDGVLIVDTGGSVRHADRGACELLGNQLLGQALGRLAPASGLEAFVRDARTAAREGFRFEVSARRDRAKRSLMASVVPVTLNDADASPLRVVLLLDLGRRRIAAEMLRAREPGIPRAQLGALLEAAHAMFRPDAITGDSPVTTRLRDEVVRAGTRSGPMLLCGERGSGKQLVGRIMHYAGTATGPILQLRCGSLMTDSLEAELFGYTKGAFPAAVADSPGLLLLAHDGTLLLTEISELDRKLQRRLVEVLDKGAIRRAGASRFEQVSTRIIATTTVDLDRLVAEGRFDAELLARLRTSVIQVPPLRQRMHDLPQLVEVMLGRFGRQGEVRSISPRANAALSSYDWPGNVAELEDCIEQACSRATDGVLDVRHLTRPLRDLTSDLPQHELIPLQRLARSSSLFASVTKGAGESGLNRREWAITDEDPISLEHYEMKALIRALDRCAGDKLKAARLLKVGKSTLYRKLKRFGIS